MYMENRFEKNFVCTVAAFYKFIYFVSWVVHKALSHQITSLHTILCDQISSWLPLSAAVAVRLVLRIRLWVVLSPLRKCIRDTMSLIYVTVSGDLCEIV